MKSDSLAALIIAITIASPAKAEVPYNSRDFEYPTNYKTTNNLKFIGYSKEKQSEVTDMMEGIGFSSDISTKKKKKKKKKNK